MHPNEFPVYSCGLVRLGSPCGWQKHLSVIKITKLFFCVVSICYGVGNTKVTRGVIIFKKRSNRANGKNITFLTSKKSSLISRPDNKHVVYFGIETVPCS